MPRPLAALAAVVLCASGLAACGGGGDPSPEDSVQAYINAIAEGRGHGAEVCSHLTGAALRERGGADCAAKADQDAGSLSPADRSTIRNLKFEVLGVHGKYATVQVLVPNAACDAGRKQILRLVKQDGAWKIRQTSDSVCATS